jgi:hypothetical protein
MGVPIERTWIVQLLAGQDPDAILTNASIYWLTNTGASVGGNVALASEYMNPGMARVTGVFDVRGSDVAPQATFG